MKRVTKIIAASALACLALQAGGARAAVSIPPNIAAAVADGNRPDADKQRDAERKPAETLTFAGIKHGETIAELLPGSGYYTRLLSIAVGPQGKLFAVVPPLPPNSPPNRQDPAARLKVITEDANYANVTVLQQPLATLSVPAPVDLVFTAQNYHDLHNVPNLDIAAFNKSVFDALKPGGIFLVVDHSAARGSGTRDTATLHRIDEASVEKEVMAAGFKSAGFSRILSNPADPRTAKVFDPAIRGKTDQFILKFRKPKD
jgi:predicted methyltransferase